MPNRASRLWLRFRERMAHRYRFIIMDEVTYDQSLQVTLSLGRILAAIVALMAIVFFATSTLIVFTPVREFIPGYTDPELRTKQQALLLKLDTMETLVTRQDSFIRSLQRVSGYTPADSQAIQRAAPDTARRLNAAPAANTNVDENTPAPLVRVAVNTISPPVWVHPVPDAQLTQGYRVANAHLGLDLAAPVGAAVLAVADGVVVLNEYTRDHGFVIGLQHAGGWVSLYKHNQVNLTAGLGTRVQAGEAIARVGNTGANTSGPHLHLELWLNGRPLDPRLYLPLASAQL